MKRDKKKIILRSLADTERLAKRIALNIRGGDVIALSGPLGAGKTAFTQALGKTLGLGRDVKSPTFIVMHTHKLKKAVDKKFQAKTLCHVDAYRLHSEEELSAIGLFDFLGHPEVITIIEWAEKIKKILPKEKTTWLTFSFTGKKRSVTIS